MFANHWVPEAHREPNPRQSLFLTCEAPEALYGGAAGGGKSDALLTAAAQYLDVPGYAALLLRRTYADLALPGALIDRSKQWWHGRAHWNGSEHRWTFPGNASVQFGYLEHADDELRYQSSEFQFVGFDELTQLPEERQYTYLFSRLRRLAGSDVPTRMRAATNPGGPGHEWVKKRFVPDAFLRAGPEEQFSRTWEKAGRLFFPARLEDNPYLDATDYERHLAELDPVTRAQLRSGDWKAHAGGRFHPRWWRRYRTTETADVFLLDDGGRVLKKHASNVVLVDPANRKTKASKYTAIGVFADLGQQRVAVVDVLRERLALEQIVPALWRVCQRHAPAWAGIEANGFQMMLVREARQKPGMPTVIEIDPEGKSKLTRATPAILRAEAGRIYLPYEAPWLDDFEAELAQFTGDDTQDSYTDQVDILAYAVLGLDRIGVGGGGMEPFTTGARAW